MKQEVKSVAYSEVRKLFSIAEKEKNELLASRYLQLALRIAKKFNLKLLPVLKRKYCHACFSFFRKGNFKTRMAKGKKVITCLKCGKIKRIPYKK
jgi:ribonuclease P protein subunit RPR2